METLTDREHEIVGHLAGGLKTKQVAAMLWVTRSDVDVHVCNAVRKTHSRNRYHLFWRYRNGEFLREPA
jgi:Response regulator containing a CheY-like receiver domain and an HTH DNA-binding domain